MILKRHLYSEETARADYRTLLAYLSEGLTDECVRLPVADAFFVFGHYNPSVATHTATLFFQYEQQHKEAVDIVITGGNCRRIPAPFRSEADYYASLLRDAGVPKQRLILEKRSSNTLENVVFGVAAYQEERGRSPAALILCAMPPLLRRARATFVRQYPGIHVWPATYDVEEDVFSKRWMGRLIQEPQRLRLYAKKGDIAIEKIPQRIERIVERLGGYLERMEKDDEYS